MPMPVSSTHSPMQKLISPDCVNCITQKLEFLLINHPSFKKYAGATSISCNMGKRDLPDMYAQKPEGRRPEG